MKKRVAVIGAGYLGRFHAQKYAQSERAELIAVVDIIPERARSVASEFGGQAYTSIDQLAFESIDCASIVCDTSAHFSVAQALLERGIDLLIEKPLTTSLVEGRALIEIAQARGCILQVGHLERFNPAFLAIQPALAAPWYFEARRITPFSGRCSDVDVIFDLMIHDIDIVCSLVAKPVTDVDAVGIPVLTGNADMASARVSFEGGCVANFTASRVAFGSERTIRVFQPSLYVSIDFDNKRLKTCSRVLDGAKPSLQMEEHSLERGDALADEIEAFLQSSDRRTTPIVSGDDGIRALEVAEMIQASMQKRLHQTECSQPQLFNHVPPESA